MRHPGWTVSNGSILCKTSSWQYSFIDVLVSPCVQPYSPLLAWALFVLLFSTLVCCQPTELIWGFFCFMNFPILPPPPALHKPVPSGRAIRSMETCALNATKGWDIAVEPMLKLQIQLIQHTAGKAGDWAVGMESTNELQHFLFLRALCKLFHFSWNSLYRSTDFSVQLMNIDFNLHSFSLSNLLRRRSSLDPKHVQGVPPKPHDQDRHRQNGHRPCRAPRGVSPPCFASLLWPSDVHDHYHAKNLPLITAGLDRLVPHELTSTSRVMILSPHTDQIQHCPLHAHATDISTGLYLCRCAPRPTEPRTPRSSYSRPQVGRPSKFNVTV